MNGRERLSELENFLCLPVGAGEKWKAPIDVITGKPLKNWQNLSFTPEQIMGMNGVVRSVGVRTGPDADNLLILDIDGESAWEFCQQYKCSKRPSTGWKICRSNAPGRFKVAFQVCDKELEELLVGVGKAVITTKQDPTGNEQIELFWAKGQCIVLGDHVSGGHYLWEGSPADIGPPP